MQNVDDALLTTAETARRLRVSEYTLRRWVREGRVPCGRLFGRTHRFRWPDVVTALGLAEPLTVAQQIDAIARGVD